MTKLGNRYFMYVPHDRAQEFENLGWTISGSLKGTHHGDYSDIAVWIGDGEPPLPANFSTSGREYKNRPYL